MDQVVTHLKQAAEAQPCPPCKEDIYKLIRLYRNEANDSKELQTQAKLGVIGVRITNVVAPLYIGRVPQLYIDTVAKDLPGNKICYHSLFAAFQIMSSKPEISIAVVKITAAFLKMAEFKVKSNAKDLYVFDKLLKFYFRTKHFSSLLSGNALYSF